jgi:hypothetical protein
LILGQGIQGQIKEILVFLMAWLINVAQNRESLTIIGTMRMGNDPEQLDTQYRGVSCCLNSL